ncbi:PQQ-binding-like beta-propeller repeat protein [Blochmannia endosymbiont of Colobopsis nipponica]|uniref:outer membrane protein assembly factor BamB family protein n=1 Tax=Blochmannia endosymbiont of Colobopsis nipponica TaxID=2681987 RepID=UPI0017821A5F|nr:PQQ-binding-like beta-propeller repeat protein [Blochmannia endosymbiont of Colobopsis nipponica]QOI10942.1 PQQ-binding-like beta-propeller repeat protein [Blochmannia endosymbiont of Colobopsis nipponica]
MFFFSGDCLSCIREQGMIETFPQTVDHQLKLTKLWEMSPDFNFVKHCSDLYFISQDANLFVASRRGIIKKINIYNGHVIWSINLSVSKKMQLCNFSVLLSGGLIISDDILYIGSELSRIYAICAKTGKVLWEVRVAGGVLSSPVISGDLLLINTCVGILQALNKYDGSIRWSISFSLPLFSFRSKANPIIVSDVAIIANDNGIINAILVNEGKILWEQKIFDIYKSKEFFFLNAIQLTPIVIGNTIYAQAYNSRLVALDVDSGQIIWRSKIDGIKNIITIGYILYIIDQDDQVIAVDAHNGKILWKQDFFLYKHLTAPVVYNDNYLFVGDRKGFVYLINMNNGNIAFQKKISSFRKSSRLVLVADNILIVLLKNCRISVFLYMVTDNFD